MQIKRTISKSNLSQIEELINQLKIDDLSRSARVQSCLNNAALQRYFTNLHDRITGRNLFHFKAYETLSDGLYVLLKGEIKFMSSARGEKQKMKKSTTSNFKASYTASINQPWSVFQCTFKNCTTFEESYLFKITEEQASETQFYEFFDDRKELYTNQYLSQDHQNLYSYDGVSAFCVDLKIHSNFSFKIYTFRQIITLTSPAIVAKGRAKLKIDHVHSHEFDRFGVLLPYLKYEVTSSELEIMIVQPNETISYRFQPVRQEEEQGYSKTTGNSLHKTEISTPDYAQSLQSKKEREKRNKELGKIFKESEPYSIISSFLCEKSLAFAKKHNILHFTKEKKENRYKNPLILFNIANEKSKLALPEFSDISNASSRQTNTKYLSSHKVSSQSEANQSAILRKIKLPPAEFSRLIKKHKQKTAYTQKKEQNGVKKAFNLSLNRVGSELSRGDEIEDQFFVPYEK